MEKPPQTLGKFIELSGSKMRLFDMGRRIVEISADNFATFEQAQTPYPYPFQQQALFAILLRNESRKDVQSIWFLKFPLDEMGLLVQAARDDFLNRLLEKVILNHDASEQNGQIDAALKDNPYSFTPNPNQMAVFHAKAAYLSGDSLSKYYDHTRQYFKGENGFDQWKFVGLQGVADIASRLTEHDNEKIVSEAIPNLPEEPFSILCTCLENESLGSALTTAIIQRIKSSLHNKPVNTGEISMGIRAISCSLDKEAQQKIYRTILDSTIGSEPETVASIAGRAWETLENQELLNCFLEKLAHSGQRCFNSLLADLLYIPSMRLLVMQALRNPKRSDQLTAAIGEMFGTGANL